MVRELFDVSAIHRALACWLGLVGRAALHRDRQEATREDAKRRVAEGVGELDHVDARRTHLRKGEHRRISTQHRCAFELFSRLRLRRVVDDPDTGDNTAHPRIVGV